VSETTVVDEPALLGHCVQVYDAMFERADNTPEGRVFTGALTKLFEELGLGIPYYTQVTRKLKGMDCIRQIQRGGGPKQSRWLLLQEPSVELFNLPDTYKERLSTSKGARTMYEQQLRDLNTRMLRLEAWAKRNGYNPNG
jgi:hypothetical protein